MSEIAIRGATREDVPRILTVLKSALGETPLLKRTAELFSWKHYDNPFGPSIVLVATSDVGDIVGVRALMRWDLMTPGLETVRCLRAVDTATAPDFQGQGIFSRLTNTAVDIAKTDGIHLIFNTPNTKSAGGYFKMGWVEVGWVKPLVRPRLGRTVNVNDGAVPDLTDALPIASAFETAGHSDRPPQGLRTPRDDRYNRWRFQSHPTARYGWVQGEKRGGAIVRTSVRGRYPELIVSDLYDPDDETALALTLAHHRTRYVAAAFTGGPELSAARDVGLRHFPRVNGLHLVANVLTDIDIDITQLASWDLAMSDLELL